TRDRTREPEPLPEPRRSVERDLTERRRVGEDPPTAANLPDALVRFTPRVPGGVSDVGQATPEVWLDLSAARDPLIRAIEHFAVHVVLTLVGRAVAPTDR